MDSSEKMAAATNNAPVTLVVNSAPCQCEAKSEFFGPSVKVLEIDIEDDTDPRKNFDAGKPNVQSNCKDPSLPVRKRCPGNAKHYFDLVSDEIAATLKRGEHAMVHCHASISRSAVFILAFLMRDRGLTLAEAGAVVKERWAAMWPCDRFVYQLVEYEKELENRKYSKGCFLVSPLQALAAVCGAAAVGFMVGGLALKRA